MLENSIVEHCAPTLAGIKTGNMFTLRDGKKEITGEIRRLNRMLTGKGLRLIPLRTAKGITMIYLYRPKRLREDLSRPEAQEILACKGYPCGHPECCLARLVRHLRDDEDFPHEIGLFLGYPPADVKGFMNGPCDGVKCIGCWKAYGNEREAKATFAKYKKCTDIYRGERKKGKPLEALIVDAS